jgi:phosphoglycolate phosphatase
MPLPRPCRLFLFDLDGTLVDSKEDIERAVNAVLARMGHPSIPLADVIRFVGDGIEPLMQRVLRKVTAHEPSFDQVRSGVNLLLEEYRHNLIGTTRLYPGVRETLDAIRWAKFGLVSNKQEELCRRLLRALGLEDRFCVVLGGDSLPRRKPDPAPILDAMSRCGAKPGETVMVGDSPSDILAGKAAGVFTCGFSGGFRSREELQAAGSDLIIDHFQELLLHFRAPAQP